jgi:thiazole synthase ThiGH ThiG subunit
VEAGRNAFLAGRIGVRRNAIASSPTTDVPQPVPANS